MRDINELLDQLLPFVVVSYSTPDFDNKDNKEVVFESLGISTSDNNINWRK